MMIAKRLGLVLVAGTILLGGTGPTALKPSPLPPVKIVLTNVTTSNIPEQVAAPQSTKQQILDAYAKLPLTFIANAGQLNSEVRYYTQGAGYGFYLTSQEAVFAFAQGSPRNEGAAAAGLRGPSASSEAHAIRSLALGLRFLGANPGAVVEGQQPVPGMVNYFIGGDPAQWHTGLPTYQQVVYRELWPGIDLALRGGAGQLKYEFRLRPGARVADIRLAYRGAERLSVDGEGTLLIDTPRGQLRDSRPASYQLIAGRRVAVASRYVLAEGAAGGSYGFAVEAQYDRDYPLVIDPGLAYSTFLGATAEDTGFAITVDRDGNAYVTGSTFSGDFPTTPGAFDRSFNGINDAFVTKLNVAGSALIYSTFLGGESSDSAFDVAIDATGNAYLAGETQSPDFPTTIGAFDRTINSGSGNPDVFVTKLNATGSALMYSTFLGGNSQDEGFSIGIDALHRAHVTGLTFSPDFPTTLGAFDRTCGTDGTCNLGPDGAPDPDAFVTKLNSTGSALVYSTYLGGASEEVGDDLAVDAIGNSYVWGGTGSRDFPTTPGAFDRTFNGGFDGFVTKLNTAGSSLVYSTYLGGTSIERISGIAVGLEGSAYVTGGTFSANFPTTVGAFDRTFNGGFEDAFVTKLNADGSSLGYSTFLGGTGNFESGSDLAVDAEGNAVMVGSTDSPDFPTTTSAVDRTLDGSGDAFITEVNAAGSALLYSTYLGGSDDESGFGIAVDATGDAYATGFTVSDDFPVTRGALQTRFGGSRDAFVTKLTLVTLCDGRRATLVGTDDNDLLNGTSNDDVIVGLAGNDNIQGNGGNDLICGGPGADAIEGGAGRDVLFGQAGNDLLDGGSSADQLIGDNGDDTLLGNSGPDELYGGNGDDELNGGTDSDFCVGGADDTADTAVNCEAVQSVP